MYFIRIESFEFSDLSHCMNTLPVLKWSFLSVLFLAAGITGGSNSNCEGNLGCGRCKMGTREGNNCH